MNNATRPEINSSRIPSSFQHGGELIRDFIIATEISVECKKLPAERKEEAALTVRTIADFNADLFPRRVRATFDSGAF